MFDFGRSRERERELLYPNACGEGKRGWISQGVASNGKGNVVRETCAFHTAKISCETLVDYWSGLNDESRQSLLQMEEEDFVAKLTYRLYLSLKLFPILFCFSGLPFMFLSFVIHASFSLTKMKFLESRIGIFG